MAHNTEQLTVGLQYRNLEHSPCPTRKTFNDYDMDTSHVDGLDPVEEAIISHATAEVRRIHRAITRVTSDREQHLADARAAINDLDRTTFLQQPGRLIEQSVVIGMIQDVAFHETDQGGVEDIAGWCVRSWLEVLRMRPGCLEALRGLGQAWLLRSQRTLARIHRHESSSSSSGGSSAERASHVTERLANSYSPGEDERQAARAVAEADTRAGTQDYVEARGLLLPATEYFRQAIVVATEAERLSGELLAQAAEASMSLGNVSYSHTQEEHFRRAITYLRLAARVPGYRLSPYLQHYLDDYGRLVD